MLAPAAVGLAIAEWRAPERLGNDIVLEHQTTKSQLGSGAEKFTKVASFSEARSTGRLAPLPDGVAPLRTTKVVSEVQVKSTRSYRLSQEAFGSTPTRPGGSGESRSFGVAGAGGVGAWGGVSGRAAAERTNATRTRTERTRSARTSGGGGGNGGSNGGSNGASENAGQGAVISDLATNGTTGRDLAEVASDGRAGGRSEGGAGGGVGGPSAAPAATPEPMSLFLMSAGLAGLYGVRRYLI